MHVVNAIAVTRMLTTATMAASAAGGGSGAALLQQQGDIPFGSLLWYAYVGISCVLVLFAGIMSGLTLGLMSLGLVELEILQRSGTPAEKKQAATILPVVQKQHQLLVTLLLCNAAAMECMWIQILDCALGHNESALFRRAQLKALVSIHSKERFRSFQAGKGGELTHDETTIISGALDLTEKVYLIKFIFVSFSSIKLV
ncbi:hypothetical protein GW17_00039268 [Ensete ventricosum]|nr:hypothetical protein GW17_00039268 [Ensete ventricosum]RZS24710.1 hypothetical protein BHM03_00057807 [Ensete ventricosum]